MKQDRPLTREQFLKKFSRAVRWRLPPKEAEEAIADYKELVFQEGRDPEKLVEELGGPVQAAHLLTGVKTYRRWLAVFGVLVFGLLLQAKWSWLGLIYVRLFHLREWWYPVLVLAVDLPLALVWFRRYGRRSGPLPQILAWALAAVSAVVCGLLAALWHASGFGIFTQGPDGSWSFEGHMQAAIGAVMVVGVLLALAGAAGLVLARCRDRRWLALYALCVTAGAALGFVLFCLLRVNTGLGLSQDISLLNFLTGRLILIGAAGLIGTGAALI